jgi:hypothetical protein
VGHLIHRPAEGARGETKMQRAAMNAETLETSMDLTTASRAAELEERVQCQLSGRLRDFRLIVGDKGLVLRGHTHSYYAKQLAQHAVMQATEFTILANEIEVR